MVHIELKIVQNLNKSTTFKSLQSLVMPFGTSFCLENQLERVSKQCKRVQKWSRSLVQIDENCVLHLVYTLKNVDKNFSMLVCDKMRSKSARFYCLDAK